MRLSFRARAACIGLCALLTAGCARYEKRPLQADLLLRQAIDDRTPAPVPEGEHVGFVDAARLMDGHGPDLLELRADYLTQRADADAPTPWPNPGVEAGPAWGFDLEDGAARSVQPFVSLGVTIPIGGRIGRERSLHGAEAERARVSLILRHRALYMDLRRAYADCVLAAETERVQNEVVAAAAESVTLARQLVQAGGATALDVMLAELRHSRYQANLYDARGETADLRAGLSALLGVDTRALPLSPLDTLPALPETLPEFNAVRDELAARHPALLELREEYEVADQALRLEIAKQYPDITLGPNYEGEPGEDKKTLSLGLGLELPLFDRNQQGVLQAERRREELRVRYQAGCARALTELERAWDRLRAALDKHTWLRDTGQKRAREAMRLAREALRAGGGDAMTYLQIAAEYRDALLECIRSEREVRAAMAAFESAAGRPIWLFPEEADWHFPALFPTNDTTAPTEEPSR